MSTLTTYVKTLERIYNQKLQGKTSKIKFNKKFSNYGIYDSHTDRNYLIKDFIIYLSLHDDIETLIEIAKTLPKNVGIATNYKNLNYKLNGFQDYINIILNVLPNIVGNINNLYNNIHSTELKEEKLINKSLNIIVTQLYQVKVMAQGENLKNNVQMLIDNIENTLKKFRKLEMDRSVESIDSIEVENPDDKSFVDTSDSEDEL